jgi:hypothetical protein
MPVISIDTEGLAKIAHEILLSEENIDVVVTAYFVTALANSPLLPPAFCRDTPARRRKAKRTIE